MFEPNLLSDRFERALVFASQVHRSQCRKVTAIPYISHLLAVCALVLENGGSEDQAIAALLHDAPEDQGGASMLERIGAAFGSHVRGLVSACGEPLELKGAPWQVRKEAFLQHLQGIPDEAVLVVAADKIHNLSCILAEHDRLGEAVFERFGGRKEGTCWYYARLSQILGPCLPPLLARRLAELA